MPHGLTVTKRLLTKDCFMKIHLTAAENDENTFLKGMIVTIAFVSTKSTCLQCVRGSHGIWTPFFFFIILVSWCRDVPYSARLNPRLPLWTSPHRRGTWEWSYQECVSIYSWICIHMQDCAVNRVFVNHSTPNAPFGLLMAKDLDTGEYTRVDDKEFDSPSVRVRTRSRAIIKW